MTAEASKNEALEKLNQGIEESRRTAQQQTMEFAQEYFDDSVEELRQQARDRRATLESLPAQVPGGHEESFQARFEQLMQKFSRLEACLEDVRNDGGDSVAEPSVAESSGRRKEVDATDAARREAKKLGVDLTQVEGTGSRGNITVNDVTSLAESSESQATKGAGQAAQAARDTAEQATQQAQAVTGQAGEQVSQIAQQTQQAAVEAAEKAGGQAQDAVDDSSEEPKATNAAWRKAEEMGVDLTRVEGTGFGGLITLGDVTDS